MPKLKTHSGAKKRFKLSKNGKVIRAHAYMSHLANGHGKTPQDQAPRPRHHRGRQDQRGCHQADAPL